MLKSYSDVLQSDLFDQAPFSIWIEDWSAVKPVIEDLRAQGVKDIQAHLWANPRLVQQLADNTRILEFNVATPQMYRAPGREEFWVFANNDFLIEEEFEAYIDTVTAFAQGQTRIVVKGWEKTWDGDQIYVRDTVFIPRDHLQDWGRVLHITEDITEYHISENALRQSEARYREIFEDSPAAIWEENWTAVKIITDEWAETGIIDWQSFFIQHPEKLVEAYNRCEFVDVSQAVLDAYRVPNKPLLYEEDKYWEISPVELSTFRDTLCAFLNNNFRYEFTAADVRYDDTKGVFREVAAMPLPYQANWSRVLYFIEDVTERVEMENALRESEARYREIFEDSPVAIWEEDWSSIKQYLAQLSSEGADDWNAYFNQNPEQLGLIYDKARIVNISQAALEAYHAPDRHSLGARLISSQVSEDELVKFGQTLCAFLSGNMSLESQATEIRFDGSQGIYRKVAVIPSAYQKDWSRILYSIEDVTEQRETELQLMQAQKMEAVGNLTGGIAHDFNNILAIIKGYAELLGEKTNEGSNLKRYILQIDDAADRAAELTHRLLAFSRQQPLQPVVVQLPALVDGMTEMFSRTLGESIEIRNCLEEPVWQVEADPGQLENVLLNLVVNSMHAMPAGGTLEFKADNLLVGSREASSLNLEAGEYARLIVVDNGSGIDANTIGHVFEPFFTTKEVGEGSGLGLSMIYGFAKQSGGTVTIESELNKGTKVSLYLPRAVSANSFNELGGQQTPALDQKRKPKLLVVEDDISVLGVIVEMLDSLNYNFEVANNGDAALAMIQQNRNIDLLITDIALEGTMSGLELALELRTRCILIPVLFVSGNTPRDINDSSKNIGDTHYLKKPFTRADLEKAIHLTLV